MAGWLHGVFVGEWLFVFPLCDFSLSLFCNYLSSTGSYKRVKGRSHNVEKRLSMHPHKPGLSRTGSIP